MDPVGDLGEAGAGDRLSIGDCQRGIPALFERVVLRHPEVPALVTPGSRCSYRELNGWANRIAWTLRDWQVAPGEIVGVLARNPMVQAAALLGVLKAGAAVVFLDVHAPAVRWRGILAETAVRVVLEEPGGSGTGIEALGQSVVCLDPTQPASQREANPEGPIDPEQLMAIYFTSGTTQEPKGICRTHQQGIFEAFAYQRTLGVTAADRLLMLISFTYGASTKHALGALLAGATLGAANPDEIGMGGVARFARDLAATVCYSTPSLFRHFARERDAVGALSLRAISLTGEPLRPGDVALWQGVAGGRAGVLLNALGSTECGAYCHLLLDRDRGWNGDALPVGMPVEGKEVLILDEHQVPVPDGLAGEIVVRSQYLSPGYWKRPEWTRAHFQEDDRRPGWRTFRTGDLGYRDAQGMIWLTGRRDFQVKIRGYRVEPGEIEQVLATQPEVLEAVVGVEQGSDGGSVLVAYLRGRGDGGSLRREDLDRHLLERLPAYMLPVRYCRVDEFPLTERGKVDRRALGVVAGSEIRAGAEPGEVGPAAPEVLRRVWEEVLGVAGGDDGRSFFACGGDSLRAMVFLERLRRETGVALPVAAFSLHPTLGGVARLLRADSGFTAAGAIMPLNEHMPGRPFLVFMPGWTRNAWALRGLADRLAGRVNCFGVELPPPGREKERIEELAAFCVRSIASLKLDGVLCLGGYSFGGLLAYETARQLEAGGRTVSVVLVLDSNIPALRDRRLRQRLSCAVANLRDLPLWVLPRYAVYLMGAPWRYRFHLAGRLRRILGAHPPGGSGGVIGSETPHLEAAQHYLPPSSPLRITLFRSWENRFRFPRDRAPWDGVAEGGVDYVQLPVFRHLGLLNAATLESIADAVAARAFGGEPRR